MRSFEDIAIEHKAAWEAGDYVKAQALFSEAAAVVEGKGTVKQMSDGALQIVPVA